jgi:hypothetical protein
MSKCSNYWYFIDQGGSERGPYSAEYMANQFRIGVINLSTKVKNNLMQNWISFNNSNLNSFISQKCSNESSKCGSTNSDELIEHNQIIGYRIYSNQEQETVQVYLTDKEKLQYRVKLKQLFFPWLLVVTYAFGIPDGWKTLDEKPFDFLLFVVFLSSIATLFHWITANDGEDLRLSDYLNTKLQTISDQRKDVHLKAKEEDTKKRLEKLIIHNFKNTGIQFVSEDDVIKVYQSEFDIKNTIQNLNVKKGFIKINEAEFIVLTREPLTTEVESIKKYIKLRWTDLKFKIQPESNQSLRNRSLATRTKSMCGRNATSVYIMYSNELIKIGFSNNPKRRLQEIRNMNPKTQLKREFWFFSEAEAVAVESKMHRHFKRHREAGEWFNISQEEATDAILRLC